ncbi:MAG: B12-binding domain-containing radical SAM protein [Armatimonadetes bacterium]|nr:B12-binding domain-containing radical SAM protein [Armatimonadota bacterium]
MKILLLHPPALSVIPDYTSESLGLGYIAAVLRRDGHEVEILDAQLQSLTTRDTVRETLAREFDCLGITAMHKHKAPLMAVARAVKAKRKNAVVVAGGYLPTLATEQLIRACPEIDIVARGEGEIVAAELFGRIARGEDWREAPGVAYMREGVPVLNPMPALIKDLDTIPFPSRDALSQANNINKAAVCSSRGCYHRCSFCSVSSFYALSGEHAARFRSPENVVDELESVISSTGIRKFVFIDDDFIGPGEKTRQRAVRIGEEIQARKLDITFNIDCRADEVDEDVLKLLKEVGLRSVFVGIESGIQRSLDTFNKRTTVEQNRQAIEILKKLDLDVELGFILFDPYTTIEELQENMRFMQGLGYPAPVHRIELFQGVPLIEQLRADGLLRENGIDLDYSFKEPATRLAWQIARTSAVWGDFVRGLTRRFGARPSGS